MKRPLLPILLVALLLVSACVNKASKTADSAMVYSEEKNLPGDSTCYGLACEGCTDSIIVLLPLSGGDPDTIDILNARINRKVFGRPKIGDQLAVIFDTIGTNVARLVVNIDELQNQWCYQVQPRLRRRFGDTASVQQLPPNLPDSLRRRWLQPREYGFDLRRDHQARPIGVVRLREAEQGPVEYPPLKRYQQWRLFNGRLLLSEISRDTTGRQQVTNTDTADLVLLRRDTLILRFANHEQSYYRKQE
jgi:hypothetical protein